MNKKLKLIIYIFIVIILILLGILLYFILNPVKGTLLCTYTSENDVYKIKSEYRIYYNKGIVNYLKTNEVITSTDTDMLEEYKTSLELVYSNYNGLDNYSNTISLEDNTLTTITLINYKELDMDKFIEIDSDNKSILEGKKVSLKKVKSLYKNNGARCRNI
jgi:hypothetical protein